MVLLLDFSMILCSSSCIAALLGGQVVLTDLFDRLRLLKKNIDANLRHGDVRGSAKVVELQWGDDPDPELIEPRPDFGNNRLAISPIEKHVLHYFGKL